MAKRAFGEGADALVVECMALTPENQAVYEHVLVRSTIGVITNIRPDHLEVMGPGLEDVAETLALTVPDRGKLVTLDGPHLDVIRQECARRDASLHLADPASVSEEELAQFRYTSFAENVALALLACELAGVDRAIALRGMVQALPDPGVSPVVSLAVDGRSLRIVNAFAANDVESTLKMWEDFRRTARFRPRPNVRNGEQQERPVRTGWRRCPGWRRASPWTACSMSGTCSVWRCGSLRRERRQWF